MDSAEEYSLRNVEGQVEHVVNRNIQVDGIVMGGRQGINIFRRLGWTMHEGTGWARAPI